MYILTFRAKLRPHPYPHAQVLEHTDDYQDIISNVVRLLKPRGHFILTLDVSVDGHMPIALPEAEQLLQLLGGQMSELPHLTPIQIIQGSLSPAYVFDSPNRSTWVPSSWTETVALTVSCHVFQKK